MLNKFKFILIGLVLMFLTSLSLSSVNAQTYGVVDTRTFILDWWNDLGKIIPKWVYFTPRIKYTDGKGVQEQFLKNIYYPWDFYAKRNITPKLVKWENPYMYIDWKHPYFIRSLTGIKKVLKWYLFAYRKSWEIFWMDAQNFTPAFLTGYESASKQSIIIYPIKSRDTRKILAFVQYPCWNLVCKDTLCTDLKVTPKCWDGVVNKSIWEQCDYNDPKSRRWCTKQCTYETLSCKVYNSREEILNTAKPSIRIKKDRNVDISKVFLDKKEFSKYTDINRNNLEPWIYTLNATAINKYSWKEFLCESTTFTVIWKEFCWDGIVNGSEQCDFKDTDNNGSCTTSCKFKWESCSISSSQIRLDNAVSFTDLIKIRYPKDTTNLMKVEVNGKVINPTTFEFNTNGTYDIKATIINPYSKSINVCTKKLTYSEKEYCWDGIKSGYEQCDDWNNQSWDGCSSKCRLETPTCRISKSSSYFSEWSKYSDYLKLIYKWNYESVQLNESKVFTDESNFLNTVVQWNKCSARNSLSLTISNKYDPSKTKVCNLTYNVKNKEYCGDGIINNDEECDTEDPITWQFCASTCTFKKPDQCHLLSNTLWANEYGSIVVESDYFALPYKASIDWRVYTARNWVFKVRVKEPWTYIMTVQLNNKLDTKHKNDKICEFNVVVEPDVCE